MIIKKIIFLCFDKKIEIGVKNRGCNQKKYIFINKRGVICSVI